MSRTTVEWSVPSLIADLGITDVFEKGIVIRDAVSGARVCVTRDGNVGRVIAPRQNTSFDIILFNIEGRTFYDVAYSGRWLSTPPFGSSARAYRKDFDGLAGEERVWGGEFLPEIGEYGVFDQFNKALNPDWSAWSYGNIERKPAPNDEKENSDTDMATASAMIPMSSSHPLEDFTGAG